MEFKIDKSTVIYPKTNVYKITLGFMLGDCDDTDEIDIFITESDFESNTKELSRFVKSILECIKHNSRRRFSIQNSGEYIGIKDWGFFCDDIYNAEDVDGKPYDCSKHSDFITYNIPTNNEGWYYTYETIEIVYYDEDGLMYNVLIEE